MKKFKCSAVIAVLLIGVLLNVTGCQLMGVQTTDVLTDISKNRNITIRSTNDNIFIELCASNEPFTIATIEQPISDKLLLATIVKNITSFIVKEEC